MPSFKRLENPKFVSSRRIAEKNVLRRMPSNRSPISTPEEAQYQGQSCAVSHQPNSDSDRLHDTAIAAQLDDDSVPFDGPNTFAEQSPANDAGANGPLLTPQEVACLEWCKEGKTNWEIGGILGISEKTVEFHLSNVKRKLGAANKISAVVIGLRHGSYPCKHFCSRGKPRGGEFRKRKCREGRHCEPGRRSEAHL